MSLFPPPKVFSKKNMHSDSASECIHACDTYTVCENYTTYSMVYLGVLCMQMPHEALKMSHIVMGNTIGIFLEVI